VENFVQLLFWPSVTCRWATRSRATARVLVKVFRPYRAVVVTDECAAWWRRCSRSAPASEPSMTPPARLSRFIISSGMPAVRATARQFFLEPAFLERLPGAAVFDYRPDSLIRWHAL
jgi:hypothetical protein